MENNRYKIETLEQFLDVANPENFERLIADFAKWLLFYIQVIETAKDSDPSLKDKTNTEIAKCAFVWVDDGKNDLLGLTVKNSETGEVKKYDAEGNLINQ